MAITTTTIVKAAGWARTDVIDQLEQAFNWAGMNGGAQQGYVIGISSFIGNGGVIVGSSSTSYYDVMPSSTTGIGTGASFYVQRSSGYIYRLYVNRPGYGYTSGDTVTLSAEDIGKSSQGASDIVLKIITPGEVSNSVSYAVTFTNTYEAAGVDRNGSVSGTNATITIKEGDLITFTNNNSSSNYRVNIGFTTENYNGDPLIYAQDYNRVFNVYNQNASYNGGICSFRPQPGQRGTYFIFDSSGYNVTTTKLVVLPADEADITYTGIGSTSTFYSKDVTSGLTYPWGVARHTIQSNKTFGDTYRGYEVVSNNTLRSHVGSAFHPNTTNWFGGELGGTHTYQMSPGYPLRFAGNYVLDLPYQPVLSDERFDGVRTFGNTTYINDSQDTQTFASSSTYQLDLNVFRSGLDPNFVVFSYRHPTLSSSKLRDNTYYTWFNHNFTSTLWDYDYVFLGGHTEIIPSAAESGGPYLEFRTYLVGESNWYNTTTPSKRCAEFGYSEVGGDSLNFGSGYRSSKYYSTNFPDSSNPVDSVGTYVRTTGVRSSGGQSQIDNVSSEANFNAVVKGLPLCVNLMPVPYYLPDDFVLIDFDYASPSANIQQGDTVTISGSEVYTVIMGSYDQTTRTRGILFCARTV